MRAIGHHDVVAHRLELGSKLLGHGDEGEIEEEQLILGVIDDVAQLVVEEARVDGVADRAHPRDAEIELEVPVGVPGQRRDAIAEADAVALQRLGEAFGARFEIGVAIAMNAALDGARDDLGVAVIGRRIGHQLRDQQRPVHHHSTHGVPTLFNRRPWST